MSTIDPRTGRDYATALDSLPTLRLTSPDDDCLGMVGTVLRADVARVSQQLRERGYVVSHSRSESGQDWLWVLAE